MHGALILADHQKTGRGQYERSWVVEPGMNLTFSLVFEPPKGERFTLLTLACALAVAEAICELDELEATLKWPNDVLINGKKVCGILTETQYCGNKLERVVIGIGINVNQVNFKGELCETATSLAKEGKEIIDRETLLAQLLQKIEYRYRQWSQFQPALIQDINKKLIGYGKWINLSVNNEDLDGEFKFLGVNEAGAFVALDKELDVRTFAFEQVRLK